MYCGKSVLFGSIGVFLTLNVLLGQEEFIRGDANHDGTVSVSDAATLANCFFNGFDDLVVGRCWDAGDTEDDGQSDLMDVVRICELLFAGGPLGGHPQFTFPAPYPTAGLDSTQDRYTCAESAGSSPMPDQSFVIEVGNVQGQVGSVITVPVFATTPVIVDGFSVALTYSPAELSIEGFTLVGTAYEGLPEPFFAAWYGQLTSTHEYLGLPPPVPVAGEYVMGVLNRIGEAFRLPALNHQVLVKLQVRILGGEPGQELSITPTSGIHDPPVFNEFSVLGDAVYAATYPTLRKGAVRVRDANSGLFRRGDSNVDGKIDIADAVFLLSFLFAKGEDPACADAGDANDDGRLDIADAISTLDFLFGQGSSVQWASTYCADDVTADFLTCGSYPPACSP